MAGRCLPVLVGFAAALAPSGVGVGPGAFALEGTASAWATVGLAGPPSEDLNLLDAAEAVLAVRTNLAEKMQVEIALPRAQQLENLRLARELARILAENAPAVPTALLSTEAALASRASGVEASGSLAFALEREEENLALVRELIEAGTNQDALGAAIASGRLAFKSVAASVGPAEEPVPSQENALPAEAALGLFRVHGLAPGPGEREAVLSLNELPEPLRGALARSLDAFMAYEIAAQRAFVGPGLPAIPDAGEWLRHTSTGGLGLGSFGALLRAGAELLDASEGLLEAWRSVPSGAVAHVTVNALPVLSLDFSVEDDVYVRDVAFLVDAGGHDLYLNNAGGSGLDGGTCGIPGHAAALVDFGGDDDYVSERSCGANGGGHFGAGFLLDAGGRDSYIGGDRGVNGGGSFGLGFLLDAEGDDTYRATSTANGGASLGVGMLLDGFGADSYFTEGGETNGGADFGLGFLWDGGGDDLFVGWNGAGAGGSGFLFDASGDDAYSGGNALGSDGAGFLFDGDGDDTYEGFNPFSVVQVARAFSAPS